MSASARVSWSSVKTMPLDRPNEQAQPDPVADEPQARPTRGRRLGRRGAGVGGVGQLAPRYPAAGAR
jgi:hypothetical protein